MLLYALKRLGLMTAIVAVAMTILFTMIHLVPGDPASIALGPRATPAMVQDFRERMGLDQPVAVQLLRFFGNVLSGNMGVDVWTQKSVAVIVFNELPYTVVLALAGLGWAVGLKDGAPYTGRATLEALAARPPERRLACLRLLQRGVLHAANLGFHRLFMVCLAENGIMMHLARKAGLTK